MYFYRYLKNFGDLLKSPDVDLRIVAGETIAFLYDLIQCESNVVCAPFIYLFFFVTLFLFSFNCTKGFERV